MTILGVYGNIVPKGAGCVAFDKVSYDREYVKDNYKRVSVYIVKDKDVQLKALAKSQNLSVNQLIITALKQTYGIDFSQA